jgi:cell wall-associated NlpC family hydrolase
MTADQVIAAAREAIGTPFRHQGRTIGWALDCAGLVIHVALSIGAEYRDSQGYARRPSGGLLEAALDDQPCLDRVFEMQAGDVLLMRFSGDPQHLAIYTGSTIIHAFAAGRKVCEHLLDDVWRSRIVRIYRFKGVA